MPLNLNEDKVFLINEDGKKCKEWTILKCLYGEIKQDNQVYILSNSVWYGMSNDKYERINKNIKAIQEDFYIDDCTKESTHNFQVNYLMKLVNKLLLMVTRWKFVIFLIQKKKNLFIQK